jgi:hypothetical protein
VASHWGDSVLGSTQLEFYTLGFSTGIVECPELLDAKESIDSRVEIVLSLKK